MKKAIIISGFFRTYKKTLKSIYEFLKTLDNCDIFIVYDLSEKKEELNEIINLLKPKKIKGVKSTYNCDYLNMWYKISESYLLCKNYMEETNIKYDMVMRLRLDLYINNENKVNLNKINIEKNTVYTFNFDNFIIRLIIKLINKFNKKLLLQDIFLGDINVMNLLCVEYFKILKLNYECLNKKSAESSFYIFTDLLDIKINTLNIYYILYSFKSNLTGYSLYKLKKYPIFFKDYIIHFFYIIGIFFIFLYLFIYKYVNNNSLRR